ncbi:MAG: hypothetical protein NTY07_14355 [Bacteroidia bacterium]|nr:hypothetical protein [Bacteroidia bacterium]
METSDLKFSTFFWRVTSSHMITYFIMGAIAASVLNYKEMFENPPFSYLMKPIDSPWVAIGPILQVFRGLVFSVALWFFRDIILFKKYGWLKLWGLIVGLSILSTTGPTPGSIEGLIYTKIPVLSQLKGYIEVLPQTLFFSLLVFFWYEKPKKLWNVLSVILVSIMVILCTMGLIVSNNN